MSRRVLVTGAAGGIGRALTAAFIDEGWQVAGLDRNPPGRSESNSTLRLTADVTAEPDVAMVAQQLDQAWGGLDALVNNAAATPPRKPLAEHTAEQLTGVLDVNVAGPMRLITALRPLLHAGAEPAVVNLSSIGAARAFRRNPAYCASKGAVEALTRSLALDLAPDGIRVNAIAPGMVHTHAWNGVDTGEKRRRSALVPLGRPASPADVAAAVRFFASTDASYITGVILPVDGGLAAQAYSAVEEPGIAGVEDFPTPTAGLGK